MDSAGKRRMWNICVMVVTDGVGVGVGTGIGTGVEPGGGGVVGDDPPGGAPASPISTGSGGGVVAEALSGSDIVPAKAAAFVVVSKSVTIITVRDRRPIKMVINKVREAFVVTRFISIPPTE